MPISLPAAVLGAGALGAGASIFSGLFGANAAQQAAQTQANAYTTGTNEALQFGQQGVGTLAPFVNNGTAAGDTLASFYGIGPNGSSANAGQLPQGFINSPAYQFPFQQGQRATNLGLGSQGLLQSGAASKAQQEFGQGLASQYLMSNYINPLFSLYGTGANAAGQTAQLYGNLGQTAMTGTVGAGTASAAGTVGASNALTGGLTSAASSINSGVGNLALLSLLAKGGSTPNPSSYLNTGNQFPSVSYLGAGGLGNGGLPTSFGLQ